MGPSSRALPRGGSPAAGGEEPPRPSSQAAWTRLTHRALLRCQRYRLFHDLGNLATRLHLALVADAEAQDVIDYLEAKLGYGPPFVIAMGTTTSQPS